MVGLVLGYFKEGDNEQGENWGSAVYFPRGGGDMR